MRVTTSEPEAPGRVDLLWVGALVVVGAGILIQAVRAVRIGWIPSGDDGYWSMMSRSVFSSRPPLLGSSSSGGVVAGTGFHHLGPLGFYVLAPFVAALGGVGVAVGTAVVNAASTVIAAVAVRSGAGRRAGWIVVVGSAALAATMGPELLIDPWNPHLATIPFWGACCCAWAVLLGKVWWAAPGMFLASLALQTHLSFAALAGAVGLLILMATAFWCAREPERTVPRAATGGRLRTWRWSPLVLAVSVTAVAGAPMLIQQFFGSGPGNLTSVLTGGTGQRNPLGVTAGARVLAQALDPANWLPGSWRPQVIEIDRLASPWLAVAVIVLLVGLVVASARSRRWSQVSGASFALGLVIAGVVNASALGVRLVGAPMTLARWAWPVALFATVVALDGSAALVSGRSETSGPEPSAAGGRRVGFVLRSLALVVVAGLAVANLLPRDEGSGAKAVSRRPISEMLRVAAPRVAALGRPYIEVDVQTLAAESTVALMDWLDERGVRFSLSDRVALGQAGGYRAVDGTETATVRLRGGRNVVLGAPVEGLRNIFEYLPVGAAELAWYRDRATATQARLESFYRRLRSDPGLRRSVRPARGAPLDAARNGWEVGLCGRYRELPLRSREVEASVIGDADRLRLCALDARIDEGALAVDVGPRPRPGGRS